MIGTVTITQLPPFGQDGVMRGTVSADIDPAVNRIATYIYVDGYGWVSKPTLASPTVPIGSNRTFQVDTVTGGLDSTANGYCVFVIPADVTPPFVDGGTRIPEALDSIAIAMDCEFRYGRTIDFAGNTWGVKDAALDVGPGGNHFDPNGVFVDSQGRLRLTIQFHDGFWWSSEVTLLDSLGYGTYSVQTETDFRVFDGNAVFGGFTYDAFGDDGVGSDPFREIDLEDGQFGNNDGQTSQFVRQEYLVPGNLQRYTIPDPGGDQRLTRYFR